MDEIVPSQRNQAQYEKKAINLEQPHHDKFFALS